MSITIFAVLLVSLGLVRFLADNYEKRATATLVIFATLAVMCTLQIFSNLTSLRILACWALASLAFIVLCINVALGIAEQRKASEQQEDAENEEAEELEYFEE